MDDSQDHISALLDELFEGATRDTPSRPGGSRTIATGFLDYDRATGGLRPGQLTAVTGTSGVGKSTLAINFIESALAHGRSVLCAEPAVDRTVLVWRLLASHAEIDITKARTGPPSDEDRNRLEEARRRLADARLWIAHPAVTWDQLLDQTRAAAFQHHLNLLVIDGLPNLIDTVDGDGDGNRSKTAARVVRQLGRLALEQQIAIVVTCPLARFEHGRPDMRPRLGDVAETSALEGEVGVLIGLYRDAVHDPDTRMPGMAELILLKNRYGPTGTLKLAFDHWPPRFADLVRPTPQATDETSLG